MFEQNSIIVTDPLGYFSSSLRTVLSQCSNTRCSLRWRLKTSSRETRFGCFSCLKKFLRIIEETIKTFCKSREAMLPKTIATDWKRNLIFLIHSYLLFCIISFSIFLLFSPFFLFFQLQQEKLTYIPSTSWFPSEQSFWFEGHLPSRQTFWLQLSKIRQNYI